MTPPRLTPERQLAIQAELRKSGRVSAMDVAYLLDEINALRKEAHERRGGSSEDRGGATPAGDDRVVKVPEARHDLQGQAPAEHLVARAGDTDSRSPIELTCRHGAWEADETGVQCCVFCGVTTDSRKERQA